MDTDYIKMMYQYDLMYGNGKTHVKMALRHIGEALLDLSSRMTARSLSTVESTNKSVDYKTSTPSGSTYAYNLYLASSTASPSTSNGRYRGFSVRLVKDLEEIK